MWENNTSYASRSARLNVAKNLSLQLFNALRILEIAQNGGRFQPQSEECPDQAESDG